MRLGPWGIVSTMARALALLVSVALPLLPGIAVSEDWWSLRPLEPVPEPRGFPPAWKPRNPIDAFVHARLAAANLEPSREADRRALIRRVTFDLTGLPPSPDQVEAFEKDSAPDAYERLVDRLLASPRYGERWARHWMDAAHFAETHGHDQDRIREHAWPYRDYLIESLNGDKPYARFVEEQVAADVIYPEDPGAIPALGFLAAGPWDESSLRDIREDTLDRQIGRYLDRDDIVTTVMQTFASVTVQCARCHDHKFDPVSQGEYYALQAVFAGVDRANRRYDADPATSDRRRRIRSRLGEIEKEANGAAAAPGARETIAAWERGLPGDEAWRVIAPETLVSSAGSILAHAPDGSITAGGPRPEADTYTIAALSPLPTITAIRLEALADDGLPSRGPGRTDHGNFHLSEIRALIGEGGAKPRALKLRGASSDFDQDGWTAAHAVDGNANTAWGIHPKEGRYHTAVFELEEKVSPPSGARLTLVLEQVHGRGHVLGRFRLSVTGIEPASRAAALPEGIREALAASPEARTESQVAALLAYRERTALLEELASLGPERLVYAAASDFDPDGAHRPAGKPRAVHVLERGEITKPLEEAAPGALACVTTIPSRFEIGGSQPEGARRAGLARWLTHRENPLVWRSIVNRVWHHHFGRMGGKPTHPELLDWLAVRFRDGGGSLKELHRLIVTSATYRQSSAASPGALVIDPENRLLSRRRLERLDAECVRDTLLAISGRLDLRMGGPSDRQFDLQPGLHVTPRIDYSKLDLDSDAARRRSVYRFLFRTLPDPFMDAFDCPAGDQLVAARTPSVTVQGALALWNASFVNRQCEHLAARLETMSSTVEGRIDAALRLALGRGGTREEAEMLSEHAERHGLASACRVIINLNEFLFVE